MFKNNLFIMNKDIQHLLNSESEQLKKLQDIVAK
jgi:hypothetical protein